jgi:putative addiction module killer protein
VETPSRELFEYVTPGGKIPFREWLRSLKDRDARARIRVRLNRIRMGNFGDCKPVGEGVFELRVHAGPGYRVYLAEEGPRTVLLLAGGEKGSQERDIARAREFWADYLRRRS